MVGAGQDCGNEGGMGGGGGGGGGGIVQFNALKI